MLSSWPPWRLSVVALIVSLGSGFNFGYQLLITNPAQEAFIEFLNKSSGDQFRSREELETSWGFIVSLFFWGATAGAFLIQVTADGLGRKRGLLASFFAQIASMAMSIASFFMNSVMLYSVSRVLLGASVSVSLGIGPLFITECSPAYCRGIISLATGVMLQGALVVGAIAAMPQLWGTTDDWWLLYASEMILTIFVTIACFFIHDSPGYLHARHRLTEARKVIVFYHNVEESEAEEAVSALTDPSEAKKSLGLCTVFLDRPSRYGTIVGSIVMGAMIMSGIAAINAFAVEILLSVGLDTLQASLGNVIICLMTVLGVIVSSGLIERWGRRPLLLVTFGLLAIINVVISACMFYFQETQNIALGWCVVLAICLFNFIFCLGPGPVSLFITNELVTQRGRGAASTWVNVVLNVVRSILLVAYFPIKETLGAPMAYAVLFIPPCVLTVISLYWLLPETKGLSPEQIQEELFGKKVKDPLLPDENNTTA